MTGVSNIPFYNPTDPNQQASAMAILRAQMMAQQMEKNADMPASNDMAGNVVIRHSPLEYLSHAASGYLGNQQMLKAQQMSMQLQSQGLNSALDTLGGAAGGGSAPGGTAPGAGGASTGGIDRQKLMAMYALGGPDAAAKFAESSLSPTDMEKNDGYQGLSPGQRRALTMSDAAKNVGVSGGMPNIDASGNMSITPIPGAADTQAGFAGATTRAQQGNTIMPQTINNVSGVPLTGNDALTLGERQAGLIPGQAPPQPAPMPPPAPGNPGMSLPGAAPQAPPPMPGPQSSALPPANGFAPRPPPTSYDPNDMRSMGPPPPQQPAMGPAMSPMPNPPAAIAAANAGPAPPLIGVDPVQQDATKAATLGPIAAKAEQEKTNAINDAADQKILATMQSNMPQAFTRFNNMRDAAKNSSYGLGVSEEGDGWKQQLHNQLDDKTADYNTILRTNAAQAVLPELGPLLQNSGVKGNKFLETIANNAVGVDLSASPHAKKSTIDSQQGAYVAGLKAVASRLRSRGLQSPSDEEIDAAAKKNGYTAPVAQSPSDAIAAELARRGAK